MYTEAPALIRDTPNILQRRGVGKVQWRNMINELIASEREDLMDLAVLRRKISDPELQRIISQLYERKAIRVIELNDLLHYKDDAKRSEP